MSREPLVSIIVNNYNYGRFLADAVDSALAQTYPATEVVVVDDGSTDGSRDVLAGYGGRVLSVLKENGGQGSTFNAGFRACRGEIVCFLDADDQLGPTAAATAVRLFQDAGAVNVNWPLHVLDVNGQRTGEVVPRETLPKEGRRERIVGEGPLYDWYFTPPTSGNAWAASFLHKVLPMPEAAYRISADEYLLTLAPLYGMIRTIPEPLGCYRTHGHNHYHGTVLTDERLAAYAERFEASCNALHRCLKEQGVEADPNSWKERNFNYLWPTRLLKARADLGRYIPTGARYVLVNGDEWGVGEPVEGRAAIPFLERAGQYWGSPSDDDTAIGELERARASGAEFLAFWWTQFWLLESLTRFRDYVRTRFPLVLEGAHLALYDLRSRRPGP